MTPTTGPLEKTTIYHSDNGEVCIVDNHRSVQPSWAAKLPMQQQSVLFLAARGPDTARKHHPCKPVVRAYRATVLVAAKRGRLLNWGEPADTFMALDVFADDGAWDQAVRDFIDHWSEMPQHYLAHLMHGAEILGYKHPDPRFRKRWYEFYLRCVDQYHLRPETEQQMDKRLGDWGREYWGS